MDLDTMETPQLSLIRANGGAFEGKSSYIVTPHNEDDTEKTQRASMEAVPRTQYSCIARSVSDTRPDAGPTRRGPWRRYMPT